MNSRLNVLLVFTLAATSCSLAPLTDRNVSRQGAGAHASRLSRGVQSASPRSYRIAGETYSDNASNAPYSYRGIAHYRSISQYSDEELSSASPDKLVVVLANRTDIQSVMAGLKALNPRYKLSPGSLDTITVELPEKGIAALRRHFYLLEAIPGVKLVLPKRYSTIHSVPNDPYVGNGSAASDKQWYLFHVDAPGAWNYPSITSAVGTIAVVDTGIYVGHPDFPSSRIVSGVDATPASGNTFSYGSDYADYQGHGTHVSGFVAAQANNAAGTAGLSWGTKIMPVKVSNTANLSNDDVRAGIYWAVDHGAKTINASFGDSVDDWLLFDAAAYASVRDVFLVASVGNDYSGPVKYPAAYAGQLSNVISVGAVDVNNIKASFSNVGPQLKLMAPGTHTWTSSTAIGLLSTVNPSLNSGNMYGYMSGTSMAAPIVTGAVGALRAAYTLANDVIRDALYLKSIDLGIAGRDDSYGYGLLNFGGTVEYLSNSGLIYRWDDSNTSGQCVWHSNPGLTVANMGPGHIAFQVSPTSGTGLVPLYSSVIEDTYMNEWEESVTYHYSRLSTTSGASVIGYVATSSGVQGMSKPLYKLVSPYDEEFYTTDSLDKDSLVGQGWTNMILGYCK